MKTLIAIFAALLVVSAFAQSLSNPTQEEMITWLSNPWVLYGLMILGSVISGLKQVKLAQMEGSGITVKSHFARLADFFVVWGTNTLSFIALIYSGQLNFVSAVTVGFALNELIDLNPASSRSNALMGTADANSGMKLKE
jgi:hypothetical protein